MVSKSHIRICISGSGKPYLRSYPCKERETIIDDPSSIKSSITSSNISTEERKKLLEKGFFGPDGRYVEL